MLLLLIAPDRNTWNYLIGLNIFAANKNNLKNYADNGSSCEYLI